MKLTAAVSNLNYPCTDNIVHYRILRACAYNEQLKMKCNSQVSPKKDTNTVLFFLLRKKKKFFSTSQDYFLYLLWSSLCSLVVFGWWWCKAIMNQHQHQPNALQTNLLKIKERVPKIHTKKLFIMQMIAKAFDAQAKLYFSWKWIRWEKCATWSGKTISYM